MTPGKRNYLLLSLFDFLYLFAWSSTMAFFVIWTTQHLGISATKPACSTRSTPLSPC
jgi:OHS family lactose permease-like MFS transporter